MGIPSIGIIHELFSFYGVEAIVRIGSTGAMKADIDLYEVILGDSAYSQSTFAREFCGYQEKVIYPDEELNLQIKESANKLGYNLIEGRIHSSDVFYYADNVKEANFSKTVDEYNCICVEMESFALFANAKKLGKKAACLLTVSDNIVTRKETSAEERQNSFTKMMEVALDLAEKYV